MTRSLSCTANASTANSTNPRLQPPPSRMDSGLLLLVSRVRLSEIVFAVYLSAAVQTAGASMPWTTALRASWMAMSSTVFICARGLSSKLPKRI